LVSFKKLKIIKKMPDFSIWHTWYYFKGSFFVAALPIPLTLFGWRAGARRKITF